MIHKREDIYWQERAEKNYKFTSHGMVIMKIKKIFTGILGVILGMVSIIAAEIPAPPLTAIIGAFGEDIRLIENKIQDKEVHLFIGIKFSRGKLNGRNVVLAQTGVGKVNAAMTTAVLLDRFHPAEVIFTGIAGGINPGLQPGDVVIAEKIVQYDFGKWEANGFKPDTAVNPLNGKPNPCFFPSDTRLIALARKASARVEFAAIELEKEKRKPRCITGIIASGDAFIAAPSKKNELQQQFQADAVEMEGAAIAQVCYQQGVPFIVIRSMSDNADAKANLDWKRFHQTAAGNSAQLVITLVELLNTSNAQ